MKKIIILASLSLIGAFLIVGLIGALKIGIFLAICYAIYKLFKIKGGNNENEEN